MLTHPTLDQLNQLGLFGMAKAFADTATSGDVASMTHPEWLALLLDREITYRYDKKLVRRLRYARLRHQAAVEDVDYRAARGLDRALFQKLVAGEWIDAHDNLVITGPTGVGKSYLASALGHKACRDSRSVLYQRVPKLFGDLALARGDGRYARLLRALGGVQVLILDDWGLEPLTASTAVTSKRNTRPTITVCPRARRGSGAPPRSLRPSPAWSDLSARPAPTRRLRYARSGT